MWKELLLKIRKKGSPEAKTQVVNFRAFTVDNWLNKKINQGETEHVKETSYTKM